MRVLFYGGKAQAKLNYNILIRQNFEIPYVFDADRNVKPQWECELFHEEEELRFISQRCEGFIVCIGNENRGKLRVEIARKLEHMGLQAISAIHPTTFIGENVKIGKGIQTFAGAGINDNTTIGDYCLIGMHAAIDHGCQIGDGVTIMNSSSVLGESKINNYASILPKSIIMAHATVSENEIVGPGSVIFAKR